MWKTRVSACFTWDIAREEIVENVVENSTANEWDLGREELMRVGLLPQQCRECGCGDDDACLLGLSVLLGEPVACWWVLPDLCSHCAVLPIAPVAGEGLLCA